MTPKYFELLDGHAANMRGPLKAALNHVAKVHQEILTVKANVAGNRDLSAEGKTKEARSFLTKRAFELVRANMTARRLGDRIAEKRANLKIPDIDKTDVVAAAMAVEMCRRVYAMPRAEKKANLSIASLPYIQAVLAAPDELTGIDAELRNLATSRALDLAHPGKAAEIQADQEALYLLQNAAKVMSDEARALVKLPNENALADFINQAVPDQRHIAADVERETAPLAA
jgi:hypothetical protein